MAETSEDPDVVQCTAKVCREPSRDIPRIGGTKMRLGKRSLILVPEGGGHDLGWRHLNCDDD